MKPPIPIPQFTRFLRSSRPYICTTCRLSRSKTKTKSFSTSQRAYNDNDKLPSPPPHTGYAHLPSRRLIALTGPDASKYLQGVVTNTVSPPSGPWKEGFYAAFLNAKGRVLNDVFVYRLRSGHGLSGHGLGGEGEGWLIEVDGRETEKLVKMMKRSRLGSKYDVRPLEEGEVGVWSLWGDSDSDSSDSDLAILLDGQIAGCEDMRAPGMGRRVVLKGSEIPKVESEQVDEQSYVLRRYLYGIPEGQDELPRETALPQESNVDYMGGISYKKGCYVGQELTVRTHHRGVVRKRILPVQFYSQDDPIPKVLEYKPHLDYAAQNLRYGTGIKRFGKEGKSVGRVIKGLGNVGLALCRLQVMTAIGSGEESEMEGFKDGDEFVVEGGGDVVEEMGEGVLKIKAFVPEWHISQKI